MILLHLPSIPLANVLQCMDFPEILELSKLSRRMRGLVQQGNTKKYKIHLKVKPYTGTVTLETRTQRYQVAVSNARLYVFPEDRDVNLSFLRSTGIEFFRGDFILGLSEVINYFISIFGCQIASVTLEQLNRTQFTRMADWILRRQASLENLSILGGEALPSDSKRLYEWLNRVQIFKVFPDMSPYHNLMGFDAVVYSQWFSGKHILERNPIKLALSNHSMENQDVDFIMNVWKAGSLPKLKCLIIQSKGITSEGSICGMTPPIQKMRVYVKNHQKSTWAFDVRNSVEVSRNDGMKAMIQVELQDVETPRFSILVCN